MLCLEVNCVGLDVHYSSSLGLGLILKLQVLNPNLISTYLFTQAKHKSVAV